MVKARTWAVMLAVCCAVAPSLSSADMFEPSASCSKPIKPFQFTSQWEVDSYRFEIEQYKRCIQDFVNEQKEAIEVHQAAAQAAIKEWNDFVNFEMN